MLDDMEIGAAFERENKRGEYTLVVLDAPALAGPIFSDLRKSVKAGYTLEWERQPPKGPKRRGINQPAASALRRGRIFSEGELKCHVENIEDLIADSEPLESFELDDYPSFKRDDEYADQEEIMSALKEMLDSMLDYHRCRPHRVHDVFPAMCRVSIRSRSVRLGSASVIFHLPDKTKLPEWNKAI